MGRWVFRIGSIILVGENASDPRRTTEEMGAVGNVGVTEPKQAIGGDSGVGSADLDGSGGAHRREMTRFTKLV